MEPTLASSQDSDRILIAEDNTDMLRYLQKLLSEHWTVETARDGAAALAGALLRPPQLILTDVVMPVMDGFELLRRLRAHESTRAIPVILISARAGEEARAEGLEAEADDYLAKPFSAGELVARVALHLKMARFRREAADRVTRIYENISDGLIILDRDWRYTFVNAPAERMLSVSRADLLGKSVWELFPALAETEVGRKLRRVADDQITIEFEGYNEGRQRWYENRASPTPEGGVAVYFREITERKRGEEHLRRSEALLAEAQEIAHIGSWDWDLITNKLQWSDEHYRIVGLQPQEAEMTAEGGMRFIHPDDLPAVRAILETTIRIREPYSTIFRVVRDDGTVRTVQSRGQPQFDAAGRPLRLFGTMQDITERARAEEALRGSERRLSAIFANAAVGLSELSLEGRFLRVNEELCRMLGRSGIQLLEAKIADVTHPQDVHRSFQAIRRLLDTGEPVALDKRYVRPDGKTVWANSILTRLEDAHGKPTILGVTVDLTQRKATEDALRESEQRLAADLLALSRLHHVGTRLVHDNGDGAPLLLEIVDAAIAITAADMGNIQLLNGNGEELHLVASRGFSQEDMAAFGVIRRGLGICGTALERGKRVIVEDVTTDAIFTEKPVLDAALAAGIRAAQSTPLVGRAGQIVGMLSTHYHKAHRRPSARDLRVLDLLARQAADWIERTRAEAAIRIANERLDLAIRSSNVAVWEVDMPDGVRENGVFTHINLWEQLGLDETGNATDMSLSMSRVHPDDLASTNEAVEACIAGKTPTLNIENRLQHRNGSYRWMLSRGAPIRDASGKVVRLLGTTMDVTERKQAQEALENAKDVAEQANRVKDEFLATISHELRTPLAAILLWARMLASGQVKGPSQAMAHRAIVSSALAQDQLIEDLLDVSRMMAGKMRLAPREMEVAPVVRAAVEAVSATAKARNIRLTLRMKSEDKALAVQGDPDRIRQIVLNLLTNAVKFTPEGGRIGVRLRRAGDVVRVRVRDTGQGIDPEFLPHVFDRFRQADSGSNRAHGGLGLGLAIVRELVQLHGGSVSARSRGAGRGATFTIELPLLNAPRENANREADRSSSIAVERPLADLHVLLVEDDAMTRDALKWVLETSGAKVTAVESAAMARRELDGQGIEVLVSDIGLPGEDGYSLIRSIRRGGIEQKQRPLPALALTAYARSEDQEQALDAGFEAYAAKPIEPDELIRTVARLSGRSA